MANLGHNDGEIGNIRSYIISRKTESRESCEAEVGWFRGTSQGPALEHPEEGKDWNTYFQYEAHKNLLKELPEDQDDWH